VVKLFNLAEDIHEDHNLAASRPEIVERLLALAEKARADLGDVDRPGKNQRKAGWAEKGIPLILAQ
jgi:hypothetical protein